MFERLVIRNFQRHRKIIIDLDPQITTLWGGTDKGKSAVIRALKWLCLNDRPDDHINWNAEYAKVSLYLEGSKIVRKQSKTDNRYILDCDPFKSFSKGVPDPIKDLLNVSSINFQDQHESHFWLSISASEVSRQLNQIVDLNIIDSSLSNIASKVRESQSNIKVCEKRIEQSREVVESLRWVVDADLKLKEIESEEQLLNEIKEREQGITHLVEQIQTYKAEKDSIEVLVTKGQELASQLTILLSKEKEADELELVISQMIEILRFKKIDIPSIKMVEKYEELSKIISDLETQEEEIWGLARRIEDHQKSLKRLMENLESCPLCESPVKSSPLLHQISTSLTGHQSHE